MTISLVIQSYQSWHPSRARCHERRTRIVPPAIEFRTPIFPHFHYLSPPDRGSLARTEQLDTLDAILPFDRRDQLAGLLIDDDAIEKELWISFLPVAIRLRFSARTVFWTI
ncbi:hypothetical protein VP03_26875 [Sinorhizobium meliloti]|nr:hypothetical protein VP03_26875 [Sinorhizobium meliloti]